MNEWPNLKRKNETIKVNGQLRYFLHHAGMPKEVNLKLRDSITALEGWLKESDKEVTNAGRSGSARRNTS